MRPMRGVLCFNCTKSGGLVLYTEYVSTVSFCVTSTVPVTQVREVPVLSCSLCKWVVVGFVENGYAVFPDAHAKASDQGK